MLNSHQNFRNFQHSRTTDSKIVQGLDQKNRLFSLRIRSRIDNCSTNVTSTRGFALKESSSSFFVIFWTDKNVPQSSTTMSKEFQHRLVCSTTDDAVCHTDVCFYHFESCPTRCIYYVVCTSTYSHRHMKWSFYKRVY